jgi:hypothetical protein
VRADPLPQPKPTGPRRLVPGAVTAGALRVLMPGGYKEALTLFRGAHAHERSRRIYGFSWTMDLAIARRFAERWALTGEGVLLRTVAPAEAILLIREPSPDPRAKPRLLR